MATTPAITTFTSREFNQDTSRAKRATDAGPVFITDRGKPSHVLLKMEDYRRLSGESRNLLEVLSMPGLSEFEFDPPKLEIELKVPDFDD